MSLSNLRVQNFSTNKQLAHIDPAGFWLRLFAFIYDSVIAGVVATITFIGIFALLGNSFTSSSFNYLDMNLNNITDLGLLITTNGIIILAISSLLPIAVNALYYSVFEASNLQATPGKLLLGIKVASDDLLPVSFMQALKRNVLRHLHILIVIAGLFLTLISISQGRVSILSTIILLIATLACPIIFLVGHLMVAFTENKQSLHDRLSDCLVIKNDEVPNIQRFFFSALAVSLFIGCFVINYYSHEKNYKYSSKIKYSYNSINSIK